MSKIIDFNNSYTFSQYFNLPNPTEEIVAEFGYGYRRENLNLSQYSGDIAYLDSLRYYIQRNIELIEPTVEIAVREFIIAPIVAEICTQLKVKLYSEYPVNASNQLKDTFDYFLKNSQSLIVIEAKQFDTQRGFTQLAIELIALDKTLETDNKLLYGAVASGDSWRFGFLDREAKVIYRDIKLYRVPEELENLMRVLTQILI